MAVVKIDQFHGIAPRQHPTQLADGMAVTAHNVKLKNGKLVPLRQPAKANGTMLLMENGLTELADSESIHAWKKTNGDVDLLLFPGVTWMAEGNIADDNRTRIIVSGETGTSFTDIGQYSASGTTAKTWSNTPLVYMRTPDIYERKFTHVLCKNPLPAPKVSRISGDIFEDVSIVNKGRDSVATINAMAASDLKKGWTYVTSDAGIITPGPDGGLSVVENTNITWGGSNWALSSDVDLKTNIRYTYFFLTWVDEYGYESPVSPQSQILEDGSWTDGDLKYVNGDTIKVEAIGTSNFPAEAKLVRLYKVITGNEEGRIQFIKEVTATAIQGGASGFNVIVKDEDAGEVITEIESPYPDLQCILDVPGGYYVGFSPSHPKTVCFSEVDLLYSWPVSYQYNVKDNIVALAVTSNTVFVMTDGWPYVLTGTSPGGMTVTKLAGPAACVSPRGVCVYKNSVYYVGQQGLMTIYNDADAGTVCTNLTDKVFTKDQWQALNPSSCVMGKHDDALHLFFTLANGTHKGISIDLTENVNAVTTHDEAAKCVCVDNKTDKMYYVREG